MELNLDNKYYEKYIKYKKGYIMLKQLKNNNELEGGFWPFDGWGNSKAEVEPQKFVENKTYLVFHVPDADLGDAKKLKNFENLAIKNILKKSRFENNKVLKKEEEEEEQQQDQQYQEGGAFDKSKPEVVVDDEDEVNKFFMSLDDFIGKYKEGYIINDEITIFDNKNNLHDTTYSLINEHSSTLKIKYDAIGKLFDNGIKKCKIPDFKISKNNEEEGNENQEEEQEKKITPLNITIPQLINEQIKILNDEIETQITQLVTAKKETVLDIEQVKNLKLYKKGVVPFGALLSGLTNDTFLDNFHTLIDREKQKPRPNMIIQIEDDSYKLNKKFIIDIKDTIMTTIAFKQISATLTKADADESAAAAAKKT